MQPLNPFLSAFSKSAFLSICSPSRHYVLLVPTTEFLLTSRDTESGAPTSETIGSEEFLGSHVLRIAGSPQGSAVAGGKDAAQNLREVRGKAKVYNTINGRSVVIKDNLVYSNKGFKSLAHASLLNDTIWYPDTLDLKSFLIYYVSRPIVGSWEEVKIPAAILQARHAINPAGAPAGIAVDVGESSESGTATRKKEVKSFHELLNYFPLIAKQMQPGLENLFREFSLVFEHPLPPPPWAAHIPDPEPDGPITAAVRQFRSNSIPTNARQSDVGDSDARSAHLDAVAVNDEEALRVSLEAAVTHAIELFQNVDKQQLSLLGATTELTGPDVERLLERYVAENVHHLVFTRLSALRRQDDLELEAKIRQMDFIDVSQLGMAFHGWTDGKRELLLRLGGAITEFRKMSHALGPQESLQILLSTMKIFSQLTADSTRNAPAQHHSLWGSGKAAMTVNADTLVSLLLYIIIRAHVKHLGARLLYIRNFIFTEDVDSGEMGYALSTFEAVLAYLDRDSSSLRRASRRNKALWDAAAQGEVTELRSLLEPGTDAQESIGTLPSPPSPSSRRPSSSGWSFVNGSSRRSSSALTSTERFSLGSDLNHVFLFQGQESAVLEDEESPQLVHLPKITKKVAMDTRSMSSGSEISFRSRATSVVTVGSSIEGDTSIERLCQTQNASGESVLMMTVQNRRPQALQYLLSLPSYFPPEAVLEDRNNDGTTLFSAAVQLGDVELLDILIAFMFQSASPERIRTYLALADTWGRSAAHYLFHAPFLMARIGRQMPWRQKDRNGQTPLFALCRSYDHHNYHGMVEEALTTATETQGDGQPLHLDEHMDGRGNTLLHIVNDAELATRILHTCDVDVNATNDKTFTALMVASKYGRFDMVRVLFGDPRVDVAAREMRGLTAVELAKDDDVRNKIDDLALFTMPASADSRTTGVVRSYFVEDASVRFVVKSGAPADQHSYAVTTCRRSLADFEHLVGMLARENPASWIPSLASLRSPTQIPSKPSRAVLRDLQVRMDWLLRILLVHSTFSAHEMLWEFFLVPDLQVDQVEQRSKLKAEIRAEKVADEMEPLEDLREVEQFVDHARDTVRSVHFSTRGVVRRAVTVSNTATDLHEACVMLSHVVAGLHFLPQGHSAAIQTYADSLGESRSSPRAVFHAAFLAVHGTIEAILKALSRPHQLIGQIAACHREAERHQNSMNRSLRWPLGLLDDARQRVHEERGDRVRRSLAEAVTLAKELRHTQQVVAGELAGWQDMHEWLGRRAIRDLARSMITAETMRLEGLQRALRKLREPQTAPVSDIVSPAGGSSESPGNGSAP